MAETLTLTTAIVPPTRTTIHLERLTIDVDAQSILVQWLANDGSPGSASYPTPAILAPVGSLQPSGATLISQLNTANLSTTSLVKRILQRLTADGYLVGTIGGTPL